MYAWFPNKHHLVKQTEANCNDRNRCGQDSPGTPYLRQKSEYKPWEKEMLISLGKRTRDVYISFLVQVVHQVHKHRKPASHCANIVQLMPLSRSQKDAFHFERFLCVVHGRRYESQQSHIEVEQHFATMSQDEEREKTEVAASV